MSDKKPTGGDNDYYVVRITGPKRFPPYTAECEDIIEALGMTFAEGCAFKAIWRSAAARTLGLKKPNTDEHGIYDAEKVQYYGGRMVAYRKKLAQCTPLVTPAIVGMTDDEAKGHYGVPKDVYYSERHHSFCNKAGLFLNKTFDKEWIHLAHLFPVWEDLNK